MALRDQPYLPLYVQDFQTDEKLMECTAESTGVYIRIMLVMHKSEIYGTILLKQKDKQNTNQIENFALKLLRFLPYELAIIKSAIVELVNEKVLTIVDDMLIQKRMMKDGEISEIRKNTGKLGGETTQKKNREFATEFALAKNKANSEYEIYNVNEDNNKDVKSKKEKIIPTLDEFLNYAKTLEIYKPELDYSIKAKYKTWVDAKWHDGNGKIIKIWKNTLANTLPFLKPINNSTTLFNQQPIKSTVKDI